LSRWPTQATLVAWLLIGLAISTHDGEYTGAGLIELLLAFALLLAVTLSGRRLPPPASWELVLAVVATAVIAVAHPAERYMHTSGPRLTSIQVLAAVTAIAVIALALLPAPRLVWPVGLALATATGIVTILFVPNPHIDVWYLLQQSSDGLRRGQDMYQQHWQHSHGLQAVYPYLPGTTLLLAPFRWLATDVRAGLLLAMLLTSWQLRRLTPGLGVLALLVVVHPYWVFLVDQSWTEPLLLLFLAVAVAALVRGRPTIAVVAFALALACKQHIVLLVPLFALWPAFGWRRALASVGIAGVIVLPWVLWSPSAFWHDAVHANLSLGVIPRALCIPSYLLRSHGVVVGFTLLLGFLVIAYAAVLWRVPRTPSGLALGSAVVLLALDVANKQSFFNHYTLPMGLLVVAIAAATAAQQETAR
jgi:hypothetical protein